MQPTSLASWILKIRKEQDKQFQALENPTKKEESWRFGDLKGLDISSFSLATKKEIPSLEKRGIKDAILRISFVNGHKVAQSGNLGGKAFCLSFGEAGEKYPEIFRSHFILPKEKMGSQKYASLNMANWQEGCFIYVPKGEKIERVIEITHFSNGSEGFHCPFLLIVAEEESSVSILERFYSNSEIEAHFCIARKRIFAEKNSKVIYQGLQNLNAESHFLQISDSDIQANAEVKEFFCNLGGKWVRREVSSHLLEAFARSEMYTFSLIKDSHIVDQRTLQSHFAPDTYSDLLYKNVLYQKAKSTFSGLIDVEKGAHQTDAYQTCRNLLMSQEAEANSMPGLEIQADRVKCSHGSTSASVSDEEIFYLQTRGIRADYARFLIALGFSENLLEKVEGKANKDFFRQAIENCFRYLS